MKAIRSFFQRLQWKLALSYALVTVGTVIVLAGLLVGVVIYLDSQAPGQFNSFFWSKTAFQDNIPYLIDDRPALQRWIERVQKQGFAWTDFQSYTYRESLDYANTLIQGTQPIYVLDPDLNLVAEAPLDDPSAIGKPFAGRRPNGQGFSPSWRLRRRATRITWPRASCCKTAATWQPSPSARRITTP